MEIVDGQHRFLAAKKMGIPVIYRVVKDSGNDDFILVNSINKCLKTADYLNYYLKKGNKKMEQMDKIAKELEIPLDRIFCFMTGANRFNLERLEAMDLESHLDDFKSCVESLKEILHVLKNLPLDIPDKYLTTLKFQSALFRFLWENQIIIDVPSFINKIKRYHHLIVHGANQKLVYKMFQGVYNYGRKTCRIE